MPTSESHEELLQRLSALRAMRDSNAAIYEQGEREAVLAARAARPQMSWERIASALGRNRASVWQKYHHLAE